MGVWGLRPHRVQGRALAFRYYLMLAFMALVFFVPGLAQLPPMDRDESRYLQATSQMLETHDFIDVRFQDQPRYLQPAGIYWLEATSVALFSKASAREAWAYRMPSLAGAVISVLLTAWIGATLFGATAGFAAAVLLASSVLLGVESRIATIDGTLLAVILTAQSALLRVFLARDDGAPARRGVAALYWAALGAGLMLKGPVILLVSWGTIVGLVVSERRGAWLRRLHPAWGIPLMLGIVVPWCVAIWVVSHGDFFARSVGHNFLGKITIGQQVHGLPFGYYAVASTLSLWPCSLFAVLALPFVWRQRRTPQVRFLLAWIIPTWLSFELVATKLPHYVLPTYPAIACLAAAAVFSPEARDSVAWAFGRVWRWIARVYAMAWLVIGVGLAIAGPILLWHVEHTVRVAPILAGLIIIPLVAGSLWFVSRRRPEQAIACACGAALVVFANTFVFVLPDLPTIWMSPRIAAEVSKVKPCANSVVVSSSFSEPSLVFALGKDTVLTDAAGAADYLLTHQACGIALVSREDTPAFMAQMSVGKVTPSVLGDVRGLNYSTGKTLDLTLYAGGGKK